jgi:hypothetical protein
MGMRQVLLVCFALLWGIVGAGAGRAEEHWREEFERICAKTGEIDKLGEAELAQLILESDRLREQIAAGNDQGGKVYLFRLRKCRELFVFMKEVGASAHQ